MNLHFGLFDKFKGDAITLLLWGDDTGLAQLHAIFQQFADRERQVAALHDLPWLYPASGTELHMSVMERNGHGICLKHRTLNNRSVIEWRSSFQQFAEAAEKVGTLVSPDCQNGHQYIEVDGDSAFQVMLSKGEYPETLSS
jgi:hypothetical protein